MRRNVEVWVANPNGRGWILDPLAGTRRANLESLRDWAGITALFALMALGLVLSASF